MGGGVFVPPIWKADWPQELRDDEQTYGPPRPFALSPTIHYYTAMVQASDLSYSYSSQPSSSQFPLDEEAVERAFWQSTPTAMEELRQGTEDECHQAGAFLSRLSE
jgi:hypothetical protein